MRVLIVGGDSVTGAAFGRAAAERGHTIYETTRHRDTTRGNRLYLDLADDEVQNIALPKVDAAFFCAAISGFARCRQNPALARKVNFENTAIVARRLMTVGTYAVLLSSTAVFDFQTPHVAADAPTRPRTLHGAIKAEAEKIFLAGGAHGAVLRLTKVVTADSGQVPAWIKALRRHERIIAFSDLHIAPIGLDDATAAMLAVAEDRGAGVYQMSGAKDITYYDVAAHLAKRLKCPADLVEAKRAVDTGLPAEDIARYTSLDSSRLEGLIHRPAVDPYAVIYSLYAAHIKSEM
jgi:dTDP-4-dehydrorhamnose reductase